MREEINEFITKEKTKEIHTLLDGISFQKCMTILAACHADVLNQWVQKKDLEIARQMLDCAKSQILSDLERTFNWQ